VRMRDRFLRLLTRKNSVLLFIELISNLRSREYSMVGFKSFLHKEVRVELERK
jgi:hypothetical protein